MANDVWLHEVDWKDNGLAKSCCLRSRLKKIIKNIDKRLHEYIMLRFPYCVTLFSRGIFSQTILLLQVALTGSKHDINVAILLMDCLAGLSTSTLPTPNR